MGFMQGMFGQRKMSPYDMPDYMSPGGGIGGGLPSAQADPSLPPDPYAGQRPENPGFFQKGGMGGKMLMGAAGGALDGIAHYGGMEGGFTSGMQAAQKAQDEWGQRIALEKWKRENPEPTALQRNAEYLGGRNPEYRDSYERSQANPMTLMTDPSTGAVGFYPKGGVAPSQSPVVTVQTVEEARSLPVGTRFRGADGVERVR